MIFFAVSCNVPKRAQDLGWSCVWHWYWWCYSDGDDRERDVLVVVMVMMTNGNWRAVGDGDNGERA